MDECVGGAEISQWHRDSVRHQQWEDSKSEKLCVRRRGGIQRADRFFDKAHVIKGIMMYENA